MTAEEHLRKDVSGIVVNQLFQLAILKAENDALKVELAQLREHLDGDRRPAGVSE